MAKKTTKSAKAAQGKIKKVICKKRNAAKQKTSKHNSNKSGNDIFCAIALDVVEICPTTGLMIKENCTRGTPQYINAPMTLFPTPYPLDMYKNAIELQKPMGDVIAGIIKDPETNIHSLLRDFSAKDEFMKMLLEISRAYYDQVQRGEPAQTVQMCILRSDYMVDQGKTNTLKLVEYNSIASSFGCLSNKVHQVHEYVREKYSNDLQFNYDLQGGDYSSLIMKDKELSSLDIHKPNHSYAEKLSSSFEQAIKIYRRQMNYDSSKDVWVLFVCEDDERNLCDQKLIEVDLMLKHGIKSMRRTFHESAQQMQFDNKTKVLKLDGKEIGFIYYRTGYQQEQHMKKNKQGEFKWDPEKLETRRIFELSMAIKCPSIDIHLAGFKKYQQAFSDEKLLERIVKSKDTVKQVKHLFKGIWSLEDLGRKGAEVNQIVERAIKHPHDYVLKPQKEGGGNNFFDAELKQNLIKAKQVNLNKHCLGSYLIMERINPPMISALMLRNGQSFLVESLSELGIYSSVFIDTADNKQVLAGIPRQRIIGTLMRTKASHNNEGGVNAGFAVIDSPFIVKSEIFKQAKIKGCVQFQ